MTDITKLALTREEWSAKGYGIKKGSRPFCTIEDKVLWGYDQTYPKCSISNHYHKTYWSYKKKSYGYNYTYSDEDMSDGGFWQDMCDAGYGL